jgi:hypothetical protein
MSEARKSPGRRTFLVGLMTGAGAVAALTGVPRKAVARKEGEAPEPTGRKPILYRRTEEAERYYRTLYR